MFYTPNKSEIRVAMLAAAMLLTSPAFAHDSAAHAGGLSAGFLHPLLGADHLLAMLAVGIWAAQYNGFARWSILLSFPAVMALGAVAAMAGAALPGVEPGIAGSVAVLGLLIAFAVRIPALAATAAVSLFALVHGYAHGMELPANTSPLQYGAGFMLATLGLHAMGMAVARTVADKSARLAGAAIAAAGTYLLAGLG